MQKKVRVMWSLSKERIGRIVLGPREGLIRQFFRVWLFGIGAFLILGKFTEFGFYVAFGYEPGTEEVALPFWGPYLYLLEFVTLCVAGPGFFGSKLFWTVGRPKWERALSPIYWIIALLISLLPGRAERLPRRLRLRGRNLSGRELVRIDYRGADLRWANLSGADLRHANLSGARLTGADLTGANCQAANFMGADLTKVRVKNTTMDEADLTDAVDGELLLIKLKRQAEEAERQAAEQEEALARLHAAEQEERARQLAKEREAQAKRAAALAAIGSTGPARTAASADDFEEVCAEFMRAHGFPTARRTPQGPDGGIDVIATNAVAQAKMYLTTPVGPKDIQALIGVQHLNGKQHALFFTWSLGYTTRAASAAKQAGVICYSYNTSTHRFDRVV